MKKVICLSGINGSGKSTLAQSLLLDKEVRLATICSIDAFFMKSGDYVFNPDKIVEANSECFSRFIEGLHEEISLIICDNANISALDIAPYQLAAQSYGYSFELITIMASSAEEVKLSAGRNLHHVPFAPILAQHCRLLAREIPNGWKSTVIPFDRGY